MPIAPHFNDPDHWRQRAEESRILAEQMSDEAEKKTMLGACGLCAADAELRSKRAIASLPLLVHALGGPLLALPRARRGIPSSKVSLVPQEQQTHTPRRVQFG